MVSCRKTLLASTYTSDCTLVLCPSNVASSLIASLPSDTAPTTVELDVPLAAPACHPIKVLP